jgi:hypothetical protein
VGRKVLFDYGEYGYGYICTDDDQRIWLYKQCWREINVISLYCICSATGKGKWLYLQCCCHLNMVMFAVMMGSQYGFTVFAALMGSEYGIHNIFAVLMGSEDNVNCYSYISSCCP